MATLVNKLNREVKVIIPNMREFSTFYSDKEGVLPMFFKRDWKPVKEEHWKPTEEQLNALNFAITYFMHETNYKNPTELRDLYDELLKLK